MKRVMLGILICAAGLYGYQHRGHSRATAEAGSTEEQEFSAKTPSTEAATPSTENVAFRCDGREYCSQMKSYDEAVYFLRNCPGVKMDGDHDGIPCERQFDK